MRVIGFVAGERTGDIVNRNDVAGVGGVGDGVAGTGFKVVDGAVPAANVDNVDARAAGHHVTAVGVVVNIAFGAAEQPVIASAAVERVVARVGGGGIGLREQIVAIAAEGVVASAAVKFVVAGIAVELIVTAAAFDAVVTRAAGNLVAAA